MRKILLSLCVLMLTGCTGVKVAYETSNYDKALVVGYAELSIEASEEKHLKPGIYRSNITLELEEYPTKKVSKIQVTSSDGYFNSFSIKPGEYKIKRILLSRKLNMGNSIETRTLFFRFPHNGTFEILPGSVNNFGKLIVTTNLVESTSHFYAFEEQAHIEQFFLSSNPDSQWMKRHWNTLGFSQYTNYY